MVNSKAMAFSNPALTNTRETLKMGSITAMASIHGNLAIFTRVVIKMGKSMDMESILVWMDRGTKAVG